VPALQLETRRENRRAATQRPSEQQSHSSWLDLRERLRDHLAEEREVAVEVGVRLLVDDDF
jgi:hypothetical protein